MMKEIQGVAEKQRVGAGGPMKEIIFLVEEAPEGGYTARALGLAIFTEADDLAELRRNVREATECHFDDDHGPKVLRLHFVREEVIPL
jgi:hypothetical protein